MKASQHATSASGLLANLKMVIRHILYIPDMPRDIVTSSLCRIASRYRREVVFHSRAFTNKRHCERPRECDFADFLRNNF